MTLSRAHESVSSSGVDASRVREIYSLPFDDRGNRYFSLWREALARAGVEVHAVPRGGLMRLVFSSSFLQERTLVVHWSTVLYGSRFMAKSLVQLFIHSIAISLLKLRGWKIVWVMHNARAHEYRHPSIDRAGRTLLAANVDAIVAHQKLTQHELEKRYPNTRIAHIPHGNYIGAYGPRATNRNELRAQYGFDKDDLVFLALGTIRPYKRLEVIFEAFQKAIPSLLGRTKLWVVGKGESQYVEHLLQQYGTDKRIRIENRFVPDAELSSCLGICDYTVFCYDESELTSGGIILSLSYGVPVISRVFATTEIIQEDKNGFLFTTEEDLTALFKRLQNQHAPHSETVIQSVATDDWDTVARAHLVLYDTCHGKVS